MTLWWRCTGRVEHDRSSVLVLIRALMNALRGRESESAEICRLRGGTGGPVSKAARTRGVWG
jgi:hypothetical protein